MNYIIEVKSAQPRHWYKDMIGHRFEARPGLFGFIVATGRHQGKRIYLQDCWVVKIPPSRRRNQAVSSFSDAGQANTPQSGKIENKTLTSHTDVERQIREYAESKKRRRYAMGD